MNAMTPTREKVMLMSLTPWEMNPRGGELRGIFEFATVLQKEGIREDLHVFDRNGVRTIMQGHRRHAAGLLAGIAQVWVKDYGRLDDAEAMEILISLQNGNDPFDARELAMAARTLVRLGRTSAEVAQVFHRSAETVQLYLDLETLPHRVQESVWKGLVSLEVADLMRQLASKERQEDALEMILHDKITNQPMSGAQAKVLLQEAFLKPMRWEKEWAKMVPGLRKKHDEAQIVAWEDRDEYVIGDALPQGAFARAEEYIESSELVNPAEPLTWGGLASVYGVPIFIAPAMAISAKHLVMVPMKAVREADKGAEEPRMGRAKRSGNPTLPLTPTLPPGEGDQDEEHDEGGGGVGVGGGGRLDEVGKSARAPFSYDLERWKALLAALLSRPDAIRADGPWKPLMRMQWEALAAVLPKEVYAAMMGELNRDENERRKGLRWCFLALAALALCEGNAEEMEEAMAECEGALGVAARGAE
jgi:hypothetical protein